MTRLKNSHNAIDWRQELKSDPGLFRNIIRQTVQEILEAEMDEALGAGKSERTAGRRGYRSGYYGRGLITRVGKIRLRVPQDRQGRFSTEIFERYQRSEKALVSALAKDVRPGSIDQESQGRYRRAVWSRVLKPPTSPGSKSSQMPRWPSSPSARWRPTIPT